MPQRDIITGLDIGSFAIRAVILEQSDNGRFQIIGAAEKNSDGMMRGMVQNVEDVVSSLAEVIEEAERMTGVNIEHAVIGIGGSHIKTLLSNGVVAVSKADKEITENDVSRAIEAAQAVMRPANTEILHVIPKAFKVDGQGNIKDPVGMTGVRLEVDTQIITGLSAQIKNLTKCIYRVGIDIDDLVFSALAAAESTLTKQQKELGVALINFGAQTTSLIVYEEGEVLHTAVLPVGSRHITNDLAICLRTSFEAAEAVKLEAVNLDTKKINKRDEIDLAKFSPEEKPRTMISLKEVCDISVARVEDIFSMIDKELKKINRSGLLPAGVVFTGGGAKLPGLIEIAKERFKLPAFLGMPLGATESPIDKVNDLSYTTALGLAMLGTSGITHKKGLNIAYNDTVGKVIGRIKDLFNSLRP